MKVSTFEVNTQMRDAFCRMRIKQGQHTTHGSIIDATIKAAERGSGIHKVKDCNAHLKFSTYNSLKSQGAM